MSRKIKNITMIILVLILSICFGFTLYKAYNSASVQNTNKMEFNRNSDNEMHILPEKKDDSNDSDGMQTPPNKPDKDDENMDNPPEMPTNNIREISPTNVGNDSDLNIIYYILIGSECIILSLIIIYLIMSHFNNKSIKETFFSIDRTMIYILAVLLLSGIFTFGSTYLINNKMINNSNDNKTIDFSNNNNATYSAKKVVSNDEDITSGEYESTDSDENAIMVTGNCNVSLSNITVTKSGNSNESDSTSFYGTNSAILAKGGSNLTITNAIINTSADGANGVFSYGGSATTNNSSSDGTTINISNSKITTTGNNSGGIMTTGGGITNATNLNITTSGISSAAIRSDRGGGTVNVTNGTYKTTGQGSPAIYSTADITVNDATLISTASEGVVIEGKNQVTLNNVTLTDTNNTLNGQSTTYKNIFLYQSMSGDASDGISSFTAKNSTITTNKGDTFYVTNTKSTINLEENTIINNDDEGYFLRVQKDSWGNSGSNGGEVTLNLTNQDVLGNIVIDSISTLKMNMASSNFSGIINGNNEAKYIALKLDKNSFITLNGDSYISSLDNADITNSNINFNGYKLYVNGIAIN